MAIRYSGSVRINVIWRDTDYRCAISSPSGRYVVFVGAPAAGFGAGIAYDSPEAYDQTARAALAFAEDERPGLIDSHACYDDIQSCYRIDRSRKDVP